MIKEIKYFCICYHQSSSGIVTILCMNNFFLLLPFTNHASIHAHVNRYLVVFWSGINKIISYIIPNRMFLIGEESKVLFP